MKIKDNKIKIQKQSVNIDDTQIDSLYRSSPLENAEAFLKKYIKKRGLPVPALVPVDNVLLSSYNNNIIATWASREGLVSITFHDNLRIHYKAFRKRSSLHCEGDLVLDYSVKNFDIDLLVGLIKVVSEVE